VAWGVKLCSLTEQLHAHSQKYTNTDTPSQKKKLKLKSIVY